MEKGHSQCQRQEINPDTSPLRQWGILFFLLGLEIPGEEVGDTSVEGVSFLEKREGLEMRMPCSSQSSVLMSCGGE